MDRKDRQSRRLARIAAWSDVSQPLPVTLGVNLLRNTTLSAGLFGLLAGSLTGALAGGLGLLARRGQHLRFLRTGERTPQDALKVTPETPPEGG